MSHSIYDRTIAFAGLCQAATLVQKLARDGSCDEQAFEASLKALLCMNPKSTIDIFENEENLKAGLETICDKLNSSALGNELTRYIISVMALERKLNARNDAMSQLGDRIDTLARQSEHYPITEPQMVSNCASIYLDVISPLGPRIQIAGTPSVLQQTHNQEKVRALLLAGIRCAVLWRQVGGRRRHLIFGRKKIIEQARILLARIH
ncbi:high frequency lysogenization protein HflD [Vibrio salinus]|uniref:high frequency lysogenization protein HflD n=1 Tax=Vibrio salinus TaxID=2899784 RepID=UPI001E3BF569|nr:high frequency lysogenization protein HflD [Vibrio salinus]MCE0496246.1 high frequency lysogenization protein HflD [Vibrio salinus]